MAVRRKAYRRFKRVLLRRIIKLMNELDLWDTKLVDMPKILDSPSLLGAKTLLFNAANTKLAELEPAPPGMMMMLAGTAGVDDAGVPL